MGDVIPFAERLRALFGEDDFTAERFLLEEGLDLLATYRSIEDREVRESLLRVIRAIARRQAKKPTGS